MHLRFHYHIEGTRRCGVWCCPHTCPLHSTSAAALELSPPPGRALSQTSCDLDSGNSRKTDIITHSHTPPHLPSPPLPSSPLLTRCPPVGVCQQIPAGEEQWFPPEEKGLSCRQTAIVNVPPPPPPPPAAASSASSDEPATRP